MEPDSEHYETAIVALGHLAINVAEKYNVHFKNMISRKVRSKLFYNITSRYINPVVNTIICELEVLHFFFFYIYI